jgi:hypothetical protein
MSLHKFADMVASKGRGDDSLLIHMTPDEVQRLQSFAEANGRSLTINPETGLPEAGMLSDLFKAVAPIALGAFLGPAGAALGGGFMSAGMAGLTVGGITTLATGSLSRGLMAGLGAYGGAGLGESLMGAGTGALEAGAATAAQGQLGAANLALGEALPAQAAEQFTKDSIARQMAGATTFDKMGAGLGAITSSPSTLGTFAKDNLKYLGAAATPIMAGAMVPTTTKMPVDTNPAYIRQKLYDPFTQTYKSLAPVKASEFGNRNFSDAYTNPQTGQMATLDQRQPTPMAGGGIVALAGGGVPGYAAGGVSDADILGWFNANPGANDTLIAQTMQQAGVTPDQVARATGTDYANVNERYLAATAPVTTAPTQMMDTSGGGGSAGTGYQSVNDLYQGVLGRGVESEGAAGYWQNLFGPTIDANEVAQFQTAAQAEIDARNTGSANTGIAALNTGITGANTPAYTNQYTYANINDYIANNNLDAAGIAAAAKQFNVDPAQVTAAQNAQSVVSNVFRNVLGRDPDPNGLDYWTNQIMTGKSTGQEMLNTFIQNAKANNEIIVNPNIKLDDAVKEFGGYKSSNARDIADEWVRNTLGREVTASDRQQQWYKDAVNDAVMNTYGKAQDIYGGFKTYAKGEATATTTKAINDAKALLAAKGLTETDVVKQTGKTIAQLVEGGTNLGLDLYQASQLKAPGAASKFNFNTISKATAVPPVVPPVVPSVVPPAGVIPGGFYGNATNPGDITRNPDGTITVTPNIPYRPYGGFSGMGEVRDAYTKGGGSLGYTSPVVKTPAEHEAAYNKLTDDSLDAYNFLMGKGKNLAQTNAARSRPLMQPYFTESNRYKPKFLSYGKDGEITSSATRGTPADAKTTELTKAKTIEIVDSSGYDTQTYTAVLQEDGTYLAGNGKRYDVTGKELAAGGGMMGYAMGGGLGSLGSYSDGGRLLRGPGDGVSDSIPATIGRKQQPARLADGEFVIPARIVSELGNGSTEAGAKKLYAMMDRVQRARGKTTGKNKVAANSRADKYLPA